MKVKLNKHIFTNLKGFLCVLSIYFLIYLQKTILGKNKNIYYCFFPLKLLSNYEYWVKEIKVLTTVISFVTKSIFTVDVFFQVL